MWLGFVAVSVVATWLARKRKVQVSYIISTSKSEAKPSIFAANFIDDIELHHFTPFQFYFSQIVDQNCLKLALAKTLDRFPFAGGRFVRIDPNSTRWDVEANNRGIEFILKFVHTGHSLESLSNLALNSTPALSFASHHFSFPYPNEITSTLPLVTVQLCIVNDSFSVLTLSVSHILFDGATRALFAQTISTLCSSNSSSNNSPPELCFSKSMPQEEFASQLEKAKSDKCPFHAQAIPNTDLVVSQCIIPHQEVKRLKAILPEKRTTHEMLVSVLLFGLQGPFRLFNIVNLRPRLPSVFPKNYCGNAAGTLVCDMERISDMDSLISISERLHQEFAQFDYAQSFFALEAYGELVLQRSTRQEASMRRVYHVEHKNCLLINSWRNYPWYDLTFGLPVQPLRVGLKPYFTAQSRYVHIEQCSLEGDVRVCMMISREEEHRFRSRVGYVARNVIFL